MPKNEGREPQSYGSEKDWLTGRTGETVDRTPEKTSRHDEEFYDGDRDREDSPGTKGGTTPSVSDASHTSTRADVTGSAPKKVSLRAAGERQSYFKKRDYE